MGVARWSSLAARRAERYRKAVLDGRRIVVVVPARNEAKWIQYTLQTTPAFVDHIVVIDDASQDQTAEIAARLGDARVEVVIHPKQRGVGAAIFTGYRRATMLGGDVVAVMAGDGQMDPVDLIDVLMPVVHGQVDYVKGDRLRHPDVFRIMPLHRLAGTMVLAILTRHAIGLRQLSDSQCGYTAISAEAIGKLDLDTLWPRYGYPNDLLAALVAQGCKIHEVPVRPVYQGQKSGLKPYHFMTILYLIARSAYRKRIRMR